MSATPASTVSSARPPIASDAELASSSQPCLRGHHGEQLHTVDDVACSDGLHRFGEIAAAGSERCGDAQRYDQLGEAGVLQLALDPIAEQRGERLAGGDTLEQRQRFAHPAEPQVEVERLLGHVRLTTAAQHRCRHRMAERRGGDVTEALGRRRLDPVAGPRPIRSNPRWTPVGRSAR